MKFFATAAVVGAWAFGTLVSGMPFESNVVASAEGGTLSTRDKALGGKGKTEPFPGTDWFKSEPNSPIVAAMGERLVAHGCGAYKKGPGNQWTNADRESYKKWQQKLGYKGSDADGWPGKMSWIKLQVPATKDGGDGNGSSPKPVPKIDHDMDDVKKGGGGHQKGKAPSHKPAPKIDHDIDDIKKGIAGGQDKGAINDKLKKLKDFQKDLFGHGRREESS